MKYVLLICKRFWMIRYIDLKKGNEKRGSTFCFLRFSGGNSKRLAFRIKVCLTRVKSVH